MNIIQQQNSQQWLRHAINTFLIVFSFSLGCYAQSRDKGYIKSTSYVDEQGSKKLEHIQYDNGLGDICQEIQIGASPEGKDIVTLYEYDKFRRPYTTWLPTISSNVEGQFVNVDNLKESARNQYGDEYPYSTTEYLTSPITRKASEYLPGENRYTNNKKKIYTIDACKKGSSLDMLPTCSSETSILWNTKYNDIIMNHSEDEDGNIVEEFYNAGGYKICSQQVLPSGKQSTYYVYDNKGNLRYVIPPALSEYILAMKSSDVYTISTAADMMQKYAYIYRYDTYNRCIYKKLPGCEPIYYIYDASGNSVFSQNGEERKKSLWSFQISDKKGRLCQTGTCRLNGIADYSSAPLHDIFIYAATLNENAFYEIVWTGLTDMMNNITIHSVNYYDNYDFIGLGNVPNDLSSQMSDFTNRYAGSAKGKQTGQANAVFSDGGISRYIYTSFYYDDMGRIVMDKSTNTLGGTDTNCSQYDLLGNVLRSQHWHTAKGKSLTESYNYEYDNSARLLRATYQLDGNSEVVIKENTYDELGRLQTEGRLSSDRLSTKYSYNLPGAVKSIQSSNIFSETLYYDDENGHGNKSLWNGNISAMEWSTGPSSNAITRGYNFSYDKAMLLEHADYYQGTSNGHEYSTSYQYDAMHGITGLVRRGKLDDGSYGEIDRLSYVYNGNQLVRISDSATDEPTYNGAFNFSDGSDETDEYAYDDNGNMIRDDNKDISTISYNPIGQPSQIKFKSVNKRICYDYDATGVKLRVRHVSPISAMASDVTFHMDRFDTAQQSIASLIEVEEAPSVRASLTDLMQGLAVSNNMTIASDISGTSKTSSKTTSKSSTSSTLPKVQVSPALELSEHDEHVTDYCGNMIYEDGVLSKILFDGGCITLEDGSPVYHVYFRDHLGSVRVVCDRNGNAEQVNHYYPYGGLIGDLSTDDNKQKYRYKYNGKEFDRMHGLDTYDYGARQYDPARITWDRMDQLCEKYYHINPYVYCGGNPVRFIDPDGKQIFFPMPPIILVHLLALNHNVKTAVFYCIHNDAARAIGTPKTRGTISNTASNFEINIAKGVGLHWTSPGDQGNAIRHTLWQSIITREYGEDIAMQAGECHEDTKYTSSTKTQFRNIEDADTYIDKKNNEIGRDIGKNNPNADRKTLAKKVMERYYKNGLYVAKEKNGVYIPTLQKITKEQYEQAIRTIEKKNNNGLNK